MPNFKNVPVRLLLLLLILLGFALRLYELAGQSMWWDELSTVARTAVSLEDLFQNLFSIRNHMPLYFLLMRPWAEIGRSALIMRYFSLIWGVLTIPVMYGVGRKMVNPATGLFAAALLAISPFNIWYSQEARMYSLLLFVLLLAHLFLVRGLDKNKGRDWLGYGAMLLIALYLHYMAALIVMVHYAFFSWHYRYLKSRFKYWFFAAGAASFLFAIWLGFMMLTGGFRDAPIGWIPAAHWYEPLLTLLSFAVGSTIDPTRPWGFVVLGFCFVGMAACLYRYGRLPKTAAAEVNMKEIRPYLLARLLLLWLVIPMILLMLISLDLPIYQKRSIYVDRYLIISLPAFLILSAWGFSLLSKKREGRWFVALSFLMIVGTSGQSLNNMYHDPAYARTNWRDALAQLQTSWQEEDLLLIPPSQILPLAYYADKPLIDQVLPEDAADMSPDMVADAQRIWFINTYENIDTHGFPQTRNSEMKRTQSAYADWLVAEYRLINEWEYPGIRLFLLETKP